MGSRIQRCAGSEPDSPSSSPSTRCFGKRASIRERSSRSAAISASVTGVRSGFRVTPTPTWKWRVMSRPASQAISVAKSSPGRLDRMAPVSDIPGRIGWFLLRVFPLAANFALPSPSWPFLPDTDPPEVLESADRIVGRAFFLVVSRGLVRYFRTAGGKARWGTAPRSSCWPRHSCPCR